jgi:hypothetical protein
MLGQPHILKAEFKKGRVIENKAGVLAIIASAVILFRVMGPDYAHHGPNDKTGWISLAGMLLFWAMASGFFGFRLGVSREVRLWKLVAITYSMLAGWLLLFPTVRILLAPPQWFGAVDQILLVMGLGIGLGSVFIWQLGRRFVPVIRNHRHRTMLGLAACLFGPIMNVVFFLFIVPWLAQMPAPQFIILLAWSWSAMAAAAGLGYGLAEAAEHETSDQNSSERYV